MLEKMTQKPASMQNRPERLQHAQQAAAQSVEPF
jgi:hypothetical protein